MTQTIQTDLLIVGSGAAGMNAARVAAQQGCSVLLADKSVFGRGGATIMAQMTVAVALAEEEDDSPELHYEDTLVGSRGLGEPALIRMFAEMAPDCIREVDQLGVNWTRGENGKIRQVHAPGHSRKRCVYVDILSSGKAVSETLQKVVRRTAGVTRLSNVFITDLVVHDGEVIGAVGLHVERGEVLLIQADAVLLAAGGLTDLYARTSASATMTGDSYALAARAGARLMDMEMVQFFPIGTLYPRLVGFDPVMWDPFRYKLGGRLLNGLQEEFIDRYGSSDGGKYTAPRDVATFAIFSEVKAGRGSAHGGAYLDFRSIPEDEMYAAWGHVIDRLKEQGLDLTKQQVEVAPIAHFMIGGIAVNSRLETTVPGLFAAGEATAGTHGANRLSGNALTEAIVHGARAGQTVAEFIQEKQRANRSKPDILKAAAELVQRVESIPGRHWSAVKNVAALDSTAAAKRDLREVMWEHVGPIRNEDGLSQALTALDELERDRLPRLPISPEKAFNLQWMEALELENMVQVSRFICEAARARRESRGAHQRSDYEQTDDAYRVHFVWERGQLEKQPVGGAK